MVNSTEILGALTAYIIIMLAVITAHEHSTACQTSCCAELMCWISLMAGYLGSEGVMEHNLQPKQLQEQGCNAYVLGLCSQALPHNAITEPKLHTSVHLMLASDVSADPVTCVKLCWQTPSQLSCFCQGVCCQILHNNRADSICVPGHGASYR